MAIGIVGDAGVRANAQQPKLFVGMILILIFAEALALYSPLFDRRRRRPFSSGQTKMQAFFFNTTVALSHPMLF
jgi:hypothetical protein